VISENIEETRENTFQKPGGTYESCPHCGWKLSPWQQVLLAVDRALVCKNCWYRIILDISKTGGATSATRMD